MSALVFGAGNVGRGFLGEVFSEAGLEVVFVDLSEPIIAALNADGAYPHITVSNGSRVEKSIAPVRAIRADDPVAVAVELQKATVAATCVGVRALPAVCRTIAPALLARIQAGRPALNLLLAENLHEAPAKVRAWLVEAEPRLADLIDDNLGLIATSIGRMIPAPRPETTAVSAAAIEVEPYRFLPIDVASVKGDFPQIPAVVGDAKVRFDFYADRKLFLHNMGHAMCAYLGRLCGDEFIWQAIGRPDIYAPVRAAMVESACALAAEYAQPVGPLFDHIDDLLHRFANRATGDTTERVGRDPRRKIASGDRLLGAYALCRSHQINPVYVSLGLAAGLQQLAAEEGLDALEIEAYLDSQGFMTSPASRVLLLEQYASLAGGFDSSRQAAILDHRFTESLIP